MLGPLYSCRPDFVQASYVEVVTTLFRFTVRTSTSEARDTMGFSILTDSVANVMCKTRCVGDESWLHFESGSLRSEARTRRNTMHIIAARVNLGKSIALSCEPMCVQIRGRSLFARFLVPESVGNREGGNRITVSNNDSNAVPTLGV